ncbi:hypothetical protein QZH41_001292 [Actinostola sp. cb2023]|nr:hypothetical protein QZH41_001292 [Actinostola sp. cb2023]
MSQEGAEEEVETSSQSSQSTVLEHEVSIWQDEIEEQHQKRQVMNEALHNITGGRTSTLQSTFNTAWEDISSTQQKYYVRKARETIAASLSVISPGQEEEIWKSLRKESLGIGTKERKHFDAKSDLMDVLKAHNQADCWQTKRQILSVFDNDFSRTELQELLPSLSKWRIDQARHHAIETGRGQPVIEKPIYRTRISSAKTDHFIDYISRPELLQDVAFGTKTLKLDSGERIIIPAVIRTLIPSRIIEQYNCHCKEQGFEPAGERSLFRMLDVCYASMQKSLQGLDNITSEGTEAVDNLRKIVERLVENGVGEEWAESIDKSIKEVKRYLKTDYKVHVGREEKCCDHCTIFSLNDEDTGEFRGNCQHDNETSCERCDSLENVFLEMKSKINETDITDEQKSRILFEYKESLQAINAWKAHLLRSVNQEEAKQDVLKELDEDTCLIIIDWAMKFLPLQYRENMSQFFSKRGRSWHVSAVITKTDANFQVECFVHIFNTCTQNSFAVTSIIEHLLHTIKMEYPVVKKTFIRSDNAGC